MPLKRVLERLRAPGGCPWDRKQDAASLRTYVLEEAYELVEAIDGGQPGEIREELGDLLLQVVFQAIFAEERGVFSLDDVVDGITSKMIRRHPHVFGTRSVTSADEVLVNWERDKLASEGGKRHSLLDGIPSALPALTRAQRVQQRAAGVGFDWTSVDGPLAKVEEELGELRLAIQRAGTVEEMEEEVGDLLFSVVNVARKIAIDAEGALRAACIKFGERFRFAEERAVASGRSLAEMNAAELDALWEAAKAPRPQGS
ncbi:MAG: nucleoside triphosphate pyrophosphohydrolase [Candidatus Schekmanbacteria bacterium]|nr:nucleoside triphosphate pyrophosphohydrolase [Candidatus Schekmanbacteria bacterium]